MPASTHISLSELQALIKRGIDNAHPLPYWVTAEISELKVMKKTQKTPAREIEKAKRELADIVERGIDYEQEE